MWKGKLCKNNLKNKLIGGGFIILIISIGIILALNSCNRQIVDLNFHFDYAIIHLQNGDIIEGEIQSWKDFGDGDQIQVKVNNTTYLVHSSNVTLINK